MLNKLCPHDSILPQRAKIQTQFSNKIHDLIIIGGGMMGMGAAYGALKTGLAGSAIIILDQSPTFALEDGASRHSAGKFVSLYNKPPEELSVDIASDLKELGESEEVAAKRAHEMVVELLGYMRQGCALFDEREAKFDPTSRSVRRELLIVDRYLDKEGLQREVKNREIYGLPGNYKLLDAKSVTAELGSKLGKFRSGYIDPIGGRFHPGHYISAQQDHLHQAGIQFFLNTRISGVRWKDGLFILTAENGTTFRCKKLFSASIHDPAISKTVYEHTLPFYAHAMAINVATQPQILPRIGAFYDTNKLALYGQRRDDVLWLGRSDSVDNSFRIARRRTKKHIRITEDIFNFKPEGEIFHWNGIYYQSPNEVPIVTEEKPGFIAAGGLGGYGNTLGQVIGNLVGQYLAGQILTIPNSSVLSSIKFFSGLPHIANFNGEQEQTAGVQALLREWLDEDDRHRVRAIKLNERFHEKNLKGAAREIALPTTTMAAACPAPQPPSRKPIARYTRSRYTPPRRTPT